MPASRIFDKITSYLEDSLPRRSLTPRAGLGKSEFIDKPTNSHSTLYNSYEALPILGVRLVIKGRPRGEEMAVKHSVLHGSCPKQDRESLIDYGKWDGKLRSGVVGVKAWVHFQRPHRLDETGVFPSENPLELPESSDNARDTNDGRSLPIRLLATDRDYDPNTIQQLYNDCSPLVNSSPGLWSVERADQDPSVQALVNKLKELHTPDNSLNSRFIW